MKVQVRSAVARKSPLGTVRAMVAEHARKAPDLKLRLAVWMNPTGQLLPIWQSGVELLEVYDGLPTDSDPHFRTMFAEGRPGRPPYGLILTSPAELNLALRARHPFVRRLMRKLKRGQVRVVAPPSKRPGLQVLEGVLTPADEV